jgi:hypothetical protein
MSLRKSIFAACLISSTFCFTAGFGMGRQWIGVIASIIVGALWLAARKYPSSWLPFICLLASQGLAIAGCLSRVFPLWMILGSGISLAVWDLTLLNAALGESAFAKQTQRYENKHIQSLMLAVGAGLLIASLGRFLHLQLPFVVLLLFVALFIFGMDRAWGFIKKAGV